jgi:predicted nucleotidyltransferase
MSTRRNINLSEFNYPDEVRDYIKKIIEHSKKICGEHLLSIYLFGGLTKGYFDKEVSDVDLLFIVSDNCPLEVVAKLEKTLEYLEVKHRLINISNTLNFIFATKTAMFKSHFILQLGSLRKMDFQAMFHQGKGFELPLGKLLFYISPSKLVIRNLILECSLVYGHDVIKDVKPPMATIFDLHKSLLVGIGLSILGVVSSFITKAGTKFTYEGFKWYVLNAYYFEKKSNSICAISLEISGRKIAHNRLFDG